MGLCTVTVLLLLLSPMLLLPLQVSLHLAGHWFLYPLLNIFVGSSWLLVSNSHPALSLHLKLQLANSPTYTRYIPQYQYVSPLSLNKLLKLPVSWALGGPWKSSCSVHAVLVDLVILQLVLIKCRNCIRGT